MFSRFLNLFSSSVAPSAVLLVRMPDGDMDAILHVVPEDGTIETFSVTGRDSAANKLRCHGAVEESREEIGTVILRPDEWALGFLDRDVRARAKKILDSSSIFTAAKQEQTSSVSVPQLVEEVLKPAALDAIHALEERTLPANATKAYHAYIVYVNRSKPGAIVSEPRSIM